MAGSRLKTETSSNENFKIEKEAVEIGDEIGSGTYGSVYKALLSNEIVAVKKIDFTLFHPTKFKIENVVLQVVNQLNHAGLIKYIGYVEEGISNWIITEYMSNGSLSDYIASKSALNWSLRYKIICNLLDGLSVLHTFNILHRDIKSSNVVIDENFNAKLIDFGFAANCDKNKSVAFNKYVGTQLYQAPEYFYSYRYSIKSEVFSFAVLMWEIVTWILAETIQKDPGQVIQPFEDKLENAPKNYAKLIRLGFMKNPLDRPTTFQIKDTLIKNPQLFN